jgi:hypothetical protein
LLFHHHHQAAAAVATEAAAQGELALIINVDASIMKIESKERSARDGERREDEMNAYLKKVQLHNNKKHTHSGGGGKGSEKSERG